MRRRKRLPESIPAPFQCPNGTSRGPHQGPALEHQPYNSPVYKHLGGGDPRGGPLWSVVRGPGEPGAPRQTTEEGSCGGRRRVAASPWSLHADVGKRREEATDLQTASTWEDSWAWRGGLAPPAPGPQLGAQSNSQPVEDLREGRTAAPAARAQVYKVKTVPKGRGRGLPAAGAGAQARAKLYLSDLTR